MCSYCMCLRTQLLGINRKIKSYFSDVVLFSATHAVSLVKKVLEHSCWQMREERLPSRSVVFASSQGNLWLYISLSLRKVFKSHTVEDMQT